MLKNKTNKHKVTYKHKVVIEDKNIFRKVKYKILSLYNAPSFFMFRKNLKNSIKKIIKIIFDYGGMGLVYLFVLRLFNYKINIINFLSAFALYLLVESFVSYIKQIKKIK